MSPQSELKVVFVSNYYNHHQAPLSEALHQKTGGNYRFIATMPMSEERRRLGWGTDPPAFVKESYRDEASYRECLSLIMDADVVIAGSVPEKMLRSRIRTGKLVLRYSERLYKNLKKWLTLPLRYVKYGMDNYPYQNVYLLCASAYTAGDYAKTGSFLHRAYRWGYFPSVKKYADIEELTALKQPASMLWVARHIAWKHPEVPIGLAKRLKEEGYSFTLDIIGTGELEESMRRSIAEAGLLDRVHMLGAMKPEEVREHMERAEIYLFTSDRNEGWGAVLNEAMNSACAVVASRAIGSVPYLLKDGENGFIYRDGDTEDLARKVKTLLADRALAHRMGQNAYRTMTEVWNADVAAERLLALSESLLGGEPVDFADGPCSKEKRKGAWQ